MWQGIGYIVPMIRRIFGGGSAPVIKCDLITQDNDPIIDQNGDKLVCEGSGYDPRFITEWTVSAGQTLNIYGYTGVVYDYDIDWGDGTTETSATMTQPGGAAYQIKSHTYTNAGTYEIRITGVDFKGLFMRGAWSGAGYANDPDSRLALIALKNWGTCEITDLGQAYYRCENMVYSASDRPRLNNFSVFGDVRQTFSFCSNITSLDLSGWLDTDKFKRHDAMLQMDGTLANSKLEELNLTGWDFTNSGNMTAMCQAIGKAAPTGCAVTMPDVVAPLITTLSIIFGDTYLNSISVPNWDIGAGGNVNCYRIFWSTEFATTQEIDLSTWKIKPLSMQDFGRGLIGVSKLDLSGWDWSACNSFSLAFYFMTDLEEVAGLEEFDATNVTTIRGMFSLCYQIHFTNHNFGPKWGPNLGNCTDFSTAFSSAGYNIVGSKAGPDVSDWDTSNAPSFLNMFYRTTGWNTQLDVSNWDVGNSTSFDGMFRETNSMKDFDGSLWNVGQNTGVNTMTFQNFCRAANTETAVFGPNCSFTYNLSFFTIFYGAPIVSWSFDWATADFQECLEWRSMMLANGAMTTSQYDEFLQVIVNTNAKINEIMTMGSSTYSAAPSAGATARNTLTATRGWTIGDGGPV